MNREFDWINPPPAWSGDAGALEIETGRGTDFWRETYYGFTRDSGHAWVTPISGDFTASVRFRGAYRARYDQAGLMAVIAPDVWVKTGVEFTDGVMNFSAVVTNGRSDWSVIPLRDVPADAWIGARISRYADALLIEWAIGDAGFRLARLAPFQAGAARVGVMACSPERAGFGARFEGLEIGPAVGKNPHPT